MERILWPSILRACSATLWLKPPSDWRSIWCWCGCGFFNALASVKYYKSSWEPVKIMGILLMIVPFPMRRKSFQVFPSSDPVDSGSHRIEMVAQRDNGNLATASLWFDQCEGVKGSRLLTESPMKFNSWALTTAVLTLWTSLSHHLPLQGELGQ